jgi:hypothetical protein
VLVFQHRAIRPIAQNRTLMSPVCCNPFRCHTRCPSKTHTVSGKDHAAR